MKSRQLQVPRRCTCLVNGGPGPLLVRQARRVNQSRFPGCR